MKRTVLRTLPFVAALVAVGCQSAPKFAWWKQDKAAENSAVASNSKAPALPSAQSSPQAVAMAGGTPSTTGLAATMPAAGTVASATIPPNAAVTPPAVSIPVTSPTTVASTSAPAYPAESSLADKLVSTPNSRAHSTPLTAGATSLAAAPGTPPMVTAGPYDPSAYKPAASTAAADPLSSLDADRYATASPVAAPSPPAVVPPVSTSQALASDPADRYGAPRTSTIPSAAPGQMALTDPAAVAADRYANPSLPALASRTAQPVVGTATASTPSAAVSASAVRLAAAPGQYRPGGTSTYNAASATTAPMEIASRPPAPSATDSAPPIGSQPWTPGSTSSTPASRPY